MKQMSASMLKGNRPLGKLRPDGKLGQLYDLFKANPGSLVSSRDIRSLASPKSEGAYTTMIERLRNSYGLDIRHHSYGYYWLVGEYDCSGKYTDYMPKVLKKEGL